MQSAEEIYAVVDTGALTADIYRPAETTNCEAAILLLHGGGWRAGDKTSMARYAPSLVAHGYTVIAVQYRLLPVARWPAQIDDVCAAIAWTRKNAERFGIRPDRIILEGFSAGGHLALMAGGRRDDLAAVVAFFPPTRLTLQPSSPSEYKAERLLGPDVDAAMAQSASPVAHVRKDFPPTLLLHGSTDWAVGPGASFAMYEALNAVGARAEIHIFPGQHHEFCSVSTMIEPLQNEVAGFLEREVINPQGHAAAAVRENPFTLGAVAFAERNSASARS